MFSLTTRLCHNSHEDKKFGLSANCLSESIILWYWYNFLGTNFDFPLALTCFIKGVLHFDLREIWGWLGYSIWVHSISTKLLSPFCTTLQSGNKKREWHLGQTTYSVTPSRCTPARFFTFHIDFGSLLYNSSRMDCCTTLLRNINRVFKKISNASIALSEILKTSWNFVKNNAMPINTLCAKNVWLFWGWSPSSSENSQISSPSRSSAISLLLLSSASLPSVSLELTSFNKVFSSNGSFVATSIVAGSLEQESFMSKEESDAELSGEQDNGCLLPGQHMNSME